MPFIDGRGGVVWDIYKSVCPQLRRREGDYGIGLFDYFSLTPFLFEEAAAVNGGLLCGYKLINEHLRT